MNRHLVSTILCVLLLLGIAAVFAVPIHGLTTFERWREMRSGRIFASAATHERVVALTFDDGPDPRYTPRVLDILRRTHVKATFFVVGKMVERYPDIARRIANEGHVLGNHSETHPHMEVEANPQARREIDQCEQRIESIAGERTHLFRPPFGLWDPAVFGDVRRQGYNIILWSLAFERVKIRDSGALRRRIVRLARPGDVLLLHDGSASRRDERGPMIRELPGIIDGLKHRGFRFATIPELLHIAGDECLRPADDRLPPIWPL